MQYPGEVSDVIDALEWLKAHGATDIFLIGDSSGATQVKQTAAVPMPHCVPHCVTHCMPHCMIIWCTRGEEKIDAVIRFGF